MLALSIGLFDTLMVSSCGEASVSGVSLVDSISVLLIQILSALATGGAVVCSQYLGKKMPEKAKLSAGQLMFIMLTSSGTVMILVLFLHRFLLRTIFGQIEADVMDAAQIYFLISAISYPFLGVYNAGAALFRSIGNSKISMYTSLVMNVINIGGNAILIYGKAGVHTNLTVSNTSEKCRPGVIHTEKRIRYRRDQKINLSRIHHICFNLSENCTQ
jgi:Na+-driven multidrug efflux pump